MILDTETTGLPRSWSAPVSDLNNWPRMVQIAWSVYDAGDRHVESISHVVRVDGFTIPQDAASLHGITTKRALAEGVELASVLAEFTQTVGRSEVVVAHNIDFDISVISAEYLRLGLEPPFEGKLLVCTKEESTDFCRLPGRFGYKWPTLPELHWALFKSTYVETHDAGADVAACASCFLELKRRGVLDLGGRSA